MKYNYAEETPPAVSKEEQNMDMAQKILSTRDAHEKQG